MDERTQFIAAWLRAETSMSRLCQCFAISRKTGYKWVARYQAGGPAGLVDRSHAVHGRAGATAPSIERAILNARAKHPHWGPRKLRAWLEAHGAGPWPAPSTIGVLLHRAGVTVARRRRHRTAGTELTVAADGANAIWAADFKGWFRTGDGRRCDPLTISDIYSRYLLRCQVVGTAQFELVQPIFEAAFREYGLPCVLRTDNGPPFAAGRGLSRLAVWWIRLGIRPERIAPGRPDQNGVHERMHRTLKQETAMPPRATLAAQQRAFDRFRRIYNDERPHEALRQQPPATRYTASPRVYPESLPRVDYPASFIVRRAHPCGDIKWRGGRVRISQSLAGEPVGIQEIADGQWRVWFGPIVLGWLDARSRERLHILLPISPV